MHEPVSPWIADANADGAVTIGDILPWCHHAFFLPGDWSIWVLASHAPAVARFLELDDADYGGILSALISGAAWIALLVGVLTAWRLVRALDRRLTDAAVALYRDAPVRGRILLARLRYRVLHGLRRRRRADAPLDYSMEHDLDARELSLLEAHAAVAAPYALGLDEAAAALGLPKHRVRPLLDRLVRLELLDRSSGGYGEPAHVISRAGQALLVFRRLQ